MSKQMQTYLGLAAMLGVGYVVYTKFVKKPAAAKPVALPSGPTALQAGTSQVVTSAADAASNWLSSLVS
jgi:hypothetical protein